MTLYLKYRATNLDELDIESVRESLKKIFSSKNIPHAFLFAGPKGTGKTSAARILAKIFNCERLSKSGVPCDKCEQCVSIAKGNNLDVIEMDAASHRGIDDVRMLRDTVKLSPTKAKKKIYIIDEAHMLTTEASNALLKTLEEPPEHVVFILATTNPEKLIETIRSRTTHILFRKATVSEIVRSLKRVVSGEKIKIEDDALSVIARFSDGAFRDAIKTLELLVAEGKELSKEYLEEYIFQKKAYNLDSFIELLVRRNTKKLIETIDKLVENGMSVESFVLSILTRLRGGLLNKVGIGEEDIQGLNKEELIRLIDLLLIAIKELADSPIEELPLEIAIIKWCEGEDDSGNFHRLENEPPVASGDTSHDSFCSETLADKADQTRISSACELSTTSSEAVKSGVNDDIWKMILSLVKPINASIEALLRAARPINYDGKVLTLGVYYKFHKERLEDLHHRSVLEDVIGKVLQSPTRIVCTLVDPPPKKIIEEAKVDSVLTEGKDTDIIKIAEEIFGN